MVLDYAADSNNLGLLHGEVIIMRRSLRAALALVVIGVLTSMAGSISVLGASKFIIATGGTAGMAYPIGGAMATIWSSNIPGVSVTPQVTGGSIENSRLLEQKEAEFSIQQNNIADYAYRGTEQFKGRPIRNIRGVASLIPEPLQNIVRADSGISSVADLRGRRVSVGPPGSGNEVNSRMLLDGFGITYSDIKPLYLSYAETANHFKDRMLDCAMFTTGVGTSAIQEIATTQAVRLLSLTDQQVRDLRAKFPFFVRSVIPAGTYKGQDQDVVTVATLATLVCREDLDEELVYRATKSLFENLDVMARAHTMGKVISLATALDGLTVPLHPGAERYYREKGVIK